MNKANLNEAFLLKFSEGSFKKMNENHISEGAW